MSEVLTTLASYLPSLLVQRLMRDPTPPTDADDERFQAVLLSADISGFTALAEKLAQRGPEGAEELSGILNTIFDELINLITALGGDIVSFAGDAILALWRPTDGDITTATLRAAQCSLALQTLRSIDQRSLDIHLAMRMGIGVGEVRMLYLGGVYGRWEWLTTGEALIQAELAGQQARPGQVVLAPDAWELIKQFCEGYPVIHNGTKADGAAPGASQMILETVIHPVPPGPPEPVSLLPGMDAALRAYIPGAVQTRLTTTEGKWLAELRLVTVLFINLPDLYDPTTTREYIQHATRKLQSTIYHYEGSVNKLSVDEKGATLIAVFGLPPLTHEDDPTRGVLAAMGIQATLESMGMRSAIGITTGRAFCGEIGNAQRREYTIIGDIVNLSARLMQAAIRLPEALNMSILCDSATYHASKLRLKFETLDPIPVKGKAEPVPVYHPIGETERGERSERVITGRDKERNIIKSQLEQLLHTASSGARNPKGEPLSVLVIEGEAGMGKSRLIDDLHRQTRAMGISTLASMGDAPEKSTPYYPWRRIFSQVLDIEHLTDPALRRQRVLDTLTTHYPMMLDRAPVLNVVLPLELPENETTGQMSTQIRADTTRSVLLQLLRSKASQAPTVLIMENIHWLDSSSQALLLAVCKRLKLLLVVLTVRPINEPQSPDHYDLLRLPRTRYLRLQALTPDEITTLACYRLEVSTIPEQVITIIREKAQGNPFFTEELAYALRDSGMIEITNGEVHLTDAFVGVDEMGLPDTIQGMITSRIDRLKPVLQPILKVISVIGPVFPFRLLYDIYPFNVSEEKLFEHLTELVQLGMIERDLAATTPTFRLKNIMIQEVVYHLMSFAQRRQLHSAAAEWYEAHMADRIEELAPLLAQHFAQAEDEQALRYFMLSGDKALASFAHQEAIAQYSRALELVSQGKARKRSTVDTALLIHIYSKLGHVFELHAKYDEALRTYHQMEALGDDRDDPALQLTALNAQAQLYVRPIPAYDPMRASTLLERAKTLARHLDDPEAEAKILWTLMLLSIFGKPDPQQAIAYGEQSLARARQHGLHEQAAHTLHDLALAYAMIGAMQQSQAVLDEARTFWRAKDNLVMVSDSLSFSATNHFLLGNYDETITASADAGQLSQPISNLWGQANSRLMVGNVYLEYGRPDNAISIMEQAIELGEQCQHLTVLISTRADLAWLYATLGLVERGLVLAQQAVAVADTVGIRVLRPRAAAILARVHLLNDNWVEAEQVIGISSHAAILDTIAMLVPAHVLLAHAELAMAQHDYAMAVSSMDSLIESYNRNGVRALIYEAYYLKGQALLALGSIETAYEVLQTALAEAEALSARRVLWRILFALSQIAALRGNHREAEQLCKQAYWLVDYIANNMSDPDLRTAFLNTPNVLQVLSLHNVPHWNIT